MKLLLDTCTFLWLAAETDRIPARALALYRERLGVDALPLGEAAALGSWRLPELHRDPFDRMLIAQAVAEGLVLLTPDPEIARYPVRLEW